VIKALMGLERNFKILEDVINVTAQIKRPMENTIHFDAGIKRFKEMARTPNKKIKSNQR
jgi:hypothetical protein